MSLLDIFKREDNALSLGRIGAFAAFVVWAIISIYLAFMGKSWDGYVVMTAAAIGYMLVQLGNKQIEWKSVRIGEAVPASNVPKAEAVNVPGQKGASI